MEFRDMLLCVDLIRAGSSEIENAVTFARKQKANLTGLYPLEFPEFPGYIEAQLPKEILEKNRKFFTEHAEQAEAVFRQACTSAGIHWDWHCVEGDRAQTIITYGRLADLVLLPGGPNGDESPTGESSSRIMLECGRPVLFLPSTPMHEDAGSRIVLAWNGRREAVRAAHDALPLLSKAQWVKVVVMNPGAATSDDGGGSAHELCRHLARHGVKAEAREVKVHGESEGAALLKLAGKEDANLLVMGAYGHARWRELVIGGVTAHVLRHANLPIFLSH
ncbi:MAG: universal stress protein [Gammaproteobacteria bacterium]|nr:universal stress protein [Gammaproteobacteria bacterium]MDH3411357.1 universal stress protein [Gammaproteobacteria bacterium]